MKSQSETGRVVADVQKTRQASRLPSGKAPASLIRKQFAEDIRQKVLESLIPKHLQKQFEAENLNVVGRPDVTDVHFHDGEPLRFKAEFEVVPADRTGDYKDVEVPYQDPEVTDEDVDKRLVEDRATRRPSTSMSTRVPLEDGDFAVVALESIGGVEGEPVKQDEMVLEIGGADTVRGFTRICAASPRATRRTSKSPIPRITASSAWPARRSSSTPPLKGIRRKELPELNDEFAQDLGDYRTSTSCGKPCARHLRPAPVRGAAGGQEQDRRQAGGQPRFPGAGSLRRAADREPRGTEPARHGRARASTRASIKLDWEKVKESQRDKALREVKASMLLAQDFASAKPFTPPATKSISEVEKMRGSSREPVAAVQMRFEKDGTWAGSPPYPDRKDAQLSVRARPQDRLKS